MPKALRLFALVALRLDVGAESLRRGNFNRASALVEESVSASAAAESAAAEKRQSLTAGRSDLQKEQASSDGSIAARLAQSAIAQRATIFGKLSSRWHRYWDALALISKTVAVLGLSMMAFFSCALWFYWRASHLIERRWRSDTTGGASCRSSPPRDDSQASDADCYARLQARTGFLCIGFCNSAFTSLAGATVYFITNSLTIKTDCVSAMSDGLSTAVNIAVEHWKKRAMRDRHILALDLLGTFASLACLVGATALNLMGVIARASLPHWRAGVSKVEHLDYMICYCLFGSSVDIFTLCCWWRLRQAMNPPGLANSDWLNAASAVVRVVIGFIRNMSVVCTVCWMLYLRTQRQTATQELAARSRGDFAGSLFISGCVLVSLALLVRESLHTFSKICGRGGCSAEASREDASHTGRV